jgi:hypothetical protein
MDVTSNFELPSDSQETSETDFDRKIAATTTNLPSWLSKRSTNIDAD